MSREWPPLPCGSGKMMMIEQAMEELQILEAQHPNRFNYLKLELKSFICLLQSQNLLPPNNKISLPTSSTANTQASSTSKKRKRPTSEMHKQRIQRTDRVEVVIERAQACLKKIQQFKTSFCGFYKESDNRVTHMGYGLK